MTMLNDDTYIRRLVASTREEFYPTLEGHPADSRALTHWAMRNILAAEAITHDRLIELTKIGGSNDCSIDGWYIDDNEEVPSLHLFQAKFGGEGSRIQENDLTTFFDAPSRLLDPNRQKNADAAQLAHDFRQWIISQDIFIYMHFVTVCQLGPAAEATAVHLTQEQDLTFTLDGVDHQILCDFHLWSSAKLRVAHADLLRLGEKPSTVDKITLAGSNAASRFTEGVALTDKAPVTTIYFLAYAQDIAKIFNGPPKRWGLFRENPRGALQRKNTSIWKTLQFVEHKGRFHALNNGLSVVCDDYTISTDQSTVEVKNMRIVNGCQTTVTLGEALAQTKGVPLLDYTVLIPVRVTRTDQEEFRQAVARATNTQRQVTSADMASLKDHMRQYHELFDLMNPKYFFEIQAGNWDYMMTPDQRARYVARIERESLGQAVMAFKGKPGEALEDRRYIFERPSSSDGKGWYDEIFAKDIPAEQMLLAWKTLERVQSALQIAEKDNENPLHSSDCTRYSALVRTWLISVILARHFNLDFSKGNLTPMVSKTLAENESWFATVYEPVNEAVFHTIRELKLAYPEVESRNFFRQAHRQLADIGSASGKIPMTIFRMHLTVTTGRIEAKDRIADVLSAAATP